MQLLFPDINIRINGLPIGSVGLHLGIVDGFPGGAPEIAVNHPILGQFKLTSDCMAEIQEKDGPWRIIDSRALARLLEERYG